MEEYKKQLIERLESTRDCANDNASDMYGEKMEEVHNNHGHEYSPDNPHIWFKVLDDSIKLQAVIDAIKALPEEWVKEIAEDFMEVK